MMFSLFFYHNLRLQGPVVQSVVSLTSSLRVISLTVLADSIYNILIFFAEKMWEAFALQKLLTFFQQKISAYLHITRCKFFNESLTNDIVCFEQLGPGHYWTVLCCMKSFFVTLPSTRYDFSNVERDVCKTANHHYHHHPHHHHHGGGWVWQRCCVSYVITRASNWYWLTVGQGLLSL